MGSHWIPTGRVYHGASDSCRDDRAGRPQAPVRRQGGKASVRVTRADKSPACSCPPHGRARGGRLTPPRAFVRLRLCGARLPMRSLALVRVCAIPVSRTSYCCSITGHAEPAHSISTARSAHAVSCACRAALDPLYRRGTQTNPCAPPARTAEAWPYPIGSHQPCEGKDVLICLRMRSEREAG